jgi:protein phosphatase
MVTVQSLTYPGLKRPNNEDAVFTTELAGGYLLLAVADGVGGTRGGEVASALAIEALRGHLEGDSIADPEAALRDAFLAANAAVRAGAAKRIELASMSTTLVAGLVLDGSAWVANVGDSRAYLIHDGEAEQVSVDHSWVGEQIRSGAIAADDPLVKRFSNIVTRVVGTQDEVEVDTFGPVEVAGGSALLFCSDGLHDPVPDEDIAGAFVAPAGDVAERLIQLAIDGGGPDNVTVAILDTR